MAMWPCMGSQIYDLLSVSIPESIMQSIGHESISHAAQPCNRPAMQPDQAMQSISQPDQAMQMADLFAIL